MNREHHFETRLVSIRPALVSDVQLIFDLRRSERGNWLNPTSPNIGDQYEYFEKYLHRFESGNEIYFIMFDKRRGVDCGITRVTKLLHPTIFGWEGLIIDENATPGCAIDLTTLIYLWGFTVAAKETCGPWGVLKHHERVNRLHSIMGVAEIIGEDERYWYYEVTAKSFRDWYPKFSRRGFGVLETQTSLNAAEIRNR